MEIQFKLGICSLGDYIVQVPTESFDDVNHLPQKTHRVNRVFHVITESLPTRAQSFSGFRIIVKGFYGLAVLPLHHHELRLNSSKNSIALIRRVFHYTL